MIQRIIPSSGEKIPIIGLGTWQTFDSDKNEYPILENVLNTIHHLGGKLIDSSPMYGKSEAVIGDLTSNMNIGNEFFYATKVWTTGKQAGIDQMNTSFKKMHRESIDLMQIHNLVDWKTHLPVLREWKANGKIKYIGITHYTDSMHSELEKIICCEDIDFVQFNYSVDDRNADKRLFAAAAHHGIATIINRPFGESFLFQKTLGKPIPEWAIEYGINNWADYFLKFIISHPAVTAIIPATANTIHAAKNCESATGILLDSSIRNKMSAYLHKI
jgi:diketogulonate reductase-like aldo/keto reductase